MQTLHNIAFNKLEQKKSMVAKLIKIDNEIKFNRLKG